jgi:hypothetical protein
MANACKFQTDKKRAPPPATNHVPVSSIAIQLTHGRRAATVAAVDVTVVDDDELLDDVDVGLLRSINVGNGFDVVPVLGSRIRIHAPVRASMVGGMYHGSVVSECYQSGTMVY